MPTNSETIRELERNAATLTERIDHVRSDIVRLDVAQAKTSDSLAPLETRLSVLEERVQELKRRGEEYDRKRWMIAAALLGSVMT